MAQLYPSNFDLSKLIDAEEETAKKLLVSLDDSWFVVPQVPIVLNGKDSEIDLVLVSPDHGAFCVEVKGGLITIENGTWKSNDNGIKNPSVQGMEAKHNLVRRLKKMKVDLSKTFIQHVVALPHIVDFPPEGAGPECPREIVFTSYELDYAPEFLAQLRKDKAATISESTLLQLLRALRPDVTDIQVDGRYVQGVSDRISRVSRSSLNVLFPLDVNTRLFVEGAAGTGKTYLGHHWAERALARGERTLFVCYNRALGADIMERLADVVEALPDVNRLQAGSFHAIANRLLGTNAPVVPENADQAFWDHHHADLLISRRDEIAERFDTIIVDEAQDFMSSWITALEGLLSDPTASRLYLLTDPRQAIFADPVKPPPGATQVPLESNIRNTNAIARLVNSLGGAEVSPHTSPGPQVEIATAGAAKERRKKIAAAIKKAHEELSIPLSQILVVVPHRDDVTHLVEEGAGEYTLVRWDQRSEEAVICATIQGSKGLDRPAVIVSSMDDEPDPRLTYIGASRATVFLALVGSTSFIKHALRQPGNVSGEQSTAP